MSLLIVSVRDRTSIPGDDDPVRDALAEARRQGFEHPQTMTWGQGQAWWYPTPGTPRGSGAFFCIDARFAACVGTFHWRGRTGSDAMEALLALDLPPHQLPLDQVSGSFVMLLGGTEGVWLFNDVLGLQKTFVACGGALLSTSLMVCRAALRRPSVDRLLAQEYVLLGANHGLRTPLQGLEIMDPTVALDLRGNRASSLHRVDDLRVHLTAQSVESALDGICSAMATEFAGIVQAFGPQIGMALSGGFDSRLLLAGMDHAGIWPDLYVYGRPGDPDVQVAQQVARDLGRDIECIDKSVSNCDLPELTSQALKSNVAFFDGLPLDGVFDRGSDRSSRLLQVRQGRLNLNGGGGEILRNFFYLPDRTYSASDVVAAFYSGWLDEVFASSEDRQAFVCHLQDRVLESLGRDAGSQAARTRPLPRSDVELVYTTFRLRYWMGRNNSVSSRYGPFMTPLVTPQLVRLAAPLPMAWKDFGRLEAAVIHRLSPRVASGPSAYGFDFSEGPSWRYRQSVWMTMRRPVWTRHQSLRVQRLLGLVRPADVPTEWCRASGQEPRADWLNPAALCQTEQVNRLMTLQVLVDDGVCG